MYRITVGGTTIHASGCNDKNCLAISASLDLSINASGQMNLVLPPNNVAVTGNLIKKLKSVIRVYRDNTLIWKGRVLDTSVDFLGRLTCTCEGWMSVLCDSVVRPQSKKETITYSVKSLFANIIKKHNSEMGSSKSLTAHIIGFPTTKRKFPTAEYETSLDYIQTNFLNNANIGGRMYLGGSDMNDLYYVADGSDNASSTQEIIFGQNMLDLTHHIDASKIYTVIIPIGKDDLTIKKVNSNKDYIDASSTVINTWGRIYHQESFSDIEKAADLKKAGQNALNQNIKESITIDVSAFDLSLINVDAGQIVFGGFTKVISPVHEIDVEYRCSGMSLDLCNPANSRYTFGQNLDSTFTGRQTRANRQISAIGKYVSESFVDGIDCDFEPTIDEDDQDTLTALTLYVDGNNVYLNFDVTFDKSQSFASSTPLLSFPAEYAPTENVSVHLVDSESEEEEESEFILYIPTTSGTTAYAYIQNASTSGSIYNKSLACDIYWTKA